MNVQALHEYFDRVATVPFALGHLDCVRFVAEAVQVGWGRDYRDQLGYEDRRSAVARLRAADGLRDALDAVLGPELLAADLRPGDVAWFDTNPQTIGLIMADYAAVKSGRTIHRLDLSAVAFGWGT